MSDIAHAWEGVTPYREPDVTAPVNIEEIEETAEECIKIVRDNLGVAGQKLVEDELWALLLRCATWERDEMP